MKNKESNYKILDNKCKVLSKIKINLYQLDNILDSYVYLKEKQTNTNNIIIKNNKVIINPGIYNINELISILKYKRRLLLEEKLKSSTDNQKQIQKFNSIWEKYYLLGD